MMNRKKTWPYLFSALALTACLNLNGFVSHAGEKAQATGNRDYYRETLAGNYLAGRFAQKHNDWERASEYINRLTAIDPDNGTLQQRAMILAMGSGKVNDAIAHARSVLDDEPDNLWALMFVTLEAMLNQDYENAEKILAAMPDDGIGNYVTPILNVWAITGQGKLETNSVPGNSIQYLHLFYAADFLDRVKGLPPQVLEQVESIPLDPSDQDNIADIFSAAELHEDAHKIYAKLQADRPMDSAIADKLKRSENNKPIGDLRTNPRITSAEHGMSEAFFDIARVLYREHNDESAQIFANMALGLNPDMAKAKILLAHVQKRNERFDAAYNYYESISPDDPLYLEIQYQAAELLRDMERFDEAIDLLNDLFDTHSDVQALVQIGDIQRADEDHVAAIKTYDRAFKHLRKTDQDIGDSYWVLYYARGMSHEQNKNWPKAEADLRKALSFQAEHPYLLNYLGYSMADRGLNLAESLDMIARAVDLRPRDGYITDSLGWVHYRMGNYQEAVAPLEKAVELLPYDPTINDHLGDAYWQVGRKTEARFQWRRALNQIEDENEIAKLERKLQFGLGKAVANHTTIQPDSNRRLNP